MPPDHAELHCSLVPAAALLLSAQFNVIYFFPVDMLVCVLPSHTLSSIPAQGIQARHFLDNFQAANSLDIPRGPIDDTDAAALLKSHKYDAICISKCHFALKSFQHATLWRQRPTAMRALSQAPLLHSNIDCTPCCAIGSALYSRRIASAVCTTRRACEAAPCCHCITLCPIATQRRIVASCYRIGDHGAFLSRYTME